MKLKYIFLSLLTLATLSGCDNEELIGPGSNNNSQGEGLPAVLMINGSTNENVETKGDNSNDGDLYVFVFKSGGTFLGKGCSTDTDKSTKIASIVNTTVAPQSKDVIVVGDDMLSGTTVDVILIANPPENVKELYSKESISLEELSELTASLDDQINMYENSNIAGRSTSCQRLTMILSSGINFLGVARDDVTDQAWCTHKYKKQIPLYRLISAVRFDKIDFGDNTTGCFILTEAYLTNAYNSSKLFPDDKMSLSDQQSTQDDWKKLIENQTVSSISTNNMIKLSDGMRGVLIYSNGGTDNSPLQYKGGNNYIDENYKPQFIPEKDGSYSIIAKDIYSFEGVTTEEGTKVTLVMKGYYADKYTNYQEVMSKTNFCQYEVDMEKDKDGKYVKFRRNCIYNVSVHIFGKGTSIGGGEDSPGIPKNIDAMIEIANMAEADPVFEFGGN